MVTRWWLKDAECCCLRRCAGHTERAAGFTLLMEQYSRWCWWWLMAEAEQRVNVWPSQIKATVNAIYRLQTSNRASYFVLLAGLIEPTTHMLWYNNDVTQHILRKEPYRNKAQYVMVFKISNDDFMLNSQLYQLQMTSFVPRRSVVMCWRYILARIGGQPFISSVFGIKI